MFGTIHLVTVRAIPYRQFGAGFYYAINPANVFLAGMDAKGAAVVGDEKANQFRGEARFVRAMCYYAMLQPLCPTLLMAVVANQVCHCV